MSALRNAFQKGRPALVCYLMGGDPGLAETEKLLAGIDAAGADVIELGVPFSDPIADGPVLQAAATRALKAGTTLPKLLELSARVPGRAPRVLMGYANPFLAYGLERFARDAAKANIAGLIVPDVPLEEAKEWSDALAAHGLDLVPLAAPTTGPERLQQLARTARGFLYYVSVTGVTGARAQLPDDLASRLRELRSLSAAPVAVGFGISRPEHAQALAAHADGVVVGSAIVATHHEKGLDATLEFVRALRAAL